MTEFTDRVSRGAVVRAVFGDRRGLALFLGALAFLLVVTRVGIFITDNFTTANAFVSLTQGQLSIETPFYGSSLETPGMFEIDGRHYGRNYGQLVASLPAYVLIRGVALVAELPIAIAAVWSLLVMGLSVQIGRLVGEYRQFAIGGAVFGLLAFLGNVAVATPLSPALRHVLALQLTSILAGALLAVVIYRLGKLLVSPRAGMLASTVTLLGSPVGFWSPIPKRHVFTTFLVVTAVYALARSRADRDTDSGTVHHAGAYASTGLLAWIHAPEALVLFVSLLAVDILTRPSIDRRQAAVVTGAFGLSLVPFLVTNALITGDPFLPPRLLRALDDLWIVGPWVASAAGGVTTSFSPGTVVAATIPVVDEVLTVVETFGGLLWEGLVTLVSEPGQVYHTFVRSGYVERSPGTVGEAINLAVVESAPTVGAVVALPAIAAAGARRGIDWQRFRRPGGVAAFTIGLFGTLLALLYVARLPVYAQVTVRYLLPLYAFGVIAAMWATPVGRALERHVRTFVWSAAAGVLIGGQLVTVVVLRLDMAVGEAFQFHALVGLAAGAALAVWVLVAVRTERYDRLGAVLTGLAVAAATVFTLAVVIVYATDIGRYPIGGDQALGMVRALSDLLSRL